MRGSEGSRRSRPMRFATLTSILRIVIACYWCAVLASPPEGSGSTGGAWGEPIKSTTPSTGASQAETAASRDAARANPCTTPDESLAPAMVVPW